MSKQASKILADLKLEYMLAGIKLHILSKSASTPIVMEAMSTLIPAAVLYITALEAALNPFALTDDERYELQSFHDEELIWMRPDDGNDSVMNGWRKKVTIGDVRRATEVAALVADIEAAERE